MEKETLVGKTVLEALSLMSWTKNNGMYGVIYQNVLGAELGQKLWAQMDKRYRKLRETLS